MKSVLAINDISTLGRASLGVVVPSLSARGFKVCPMPTMALSAITAGYGVPATVDLTEFMRDSAEHFRKLDAKFDWIYTGFLGNPAQVDIIIDIISSQPQARILVDPVLGDNGKLYQTMTQEMVKQMRKLVEFADVITPNWTEARFLLDSDSSDVEEVMEGITAKNVVITSVPNCKGKQIDISVKQHNKAEIITINGDYEPTLISGTGDMFASFLLAELENGKSLAEAAEEAARVVKKEI